MHALSICLAQYAAPVISLSVLRSVKAARVIVLLILTAMGVVITHGLSYLLSYPQVAARREALAGHEHLETAGPVLVIAGVATAVLLAVLAARGRGVMRELRLSGRVLATCQLVGFLGLEVIERLDTLDQVANEPALLTGAVLQAPAAWALIRAINAGALLVRGIALVAVPTWCSVIGPCGILTLQNTRLRTVPVRHSSISRRGPPSRLV